MKILQINKFHYLKGGSERYYFDLSKELENQGHEVVFFSMQDSRNIDSKYKNYFIKHIDLYKFSFINIIKFFYNYEAVRNLKKLIKVEKPDVAHLHNIAHQLSPAIINVLKKYSIPMVQTLHDYKLVCPNSKLYSQNKICEKCKGGKYYQCFLNSCVHDSRAKSFLAMLEAYLHQTILKTYQKVDLFLAPSNFMKDVCLRFGIDEQKVKTIYNFIPKSFSESENYNKNKTNQDSYLLYFGRISEEKGIDILIEALSLLDTKVNLKIVGEGPELESIKLKINHNNLLARVDILGHKSGEELKNLILNSRAVVMPSLWPENMPFSLIETLSLGVPAIVSRVGGMPELIQDSINGFVFKRGSANDLADKINKLSQSDYRKLSEGAKKSSLSLSLKEHTLKILQVYQDILSK